MIETKIAGIVGFALAYGLVAQAQTLSGEVVDPQQRVVVNAQVSLMCRNKVETQRTDAQGRFAFSDKTAFPECRILVVQPGFATLEVSVGQARVLELPLQLAEVKQIVSVKGQSLSQAPIASASLSADELKTLYEDSNDWIAYAKNIAGAFSQNDQIYVDGLPTDHVPPTDSIETVTVNASPFSAEYSDSSETHIEITTKRAERQFQLTSGGISLGSHANNPLNSQLHSASKAASLGLMGPIPYSPLAFTANTQFNQRHMQEPIEAVVPSGPALPIAPVTVAPTGTLNTLSSFGADYSKGDSLRVSGSLYVGVARASNLDVSGLTLPEAGIGSNTNDRELRIAFRSTGTNHVYRGGVTAQGASTHLLANNKGLGISVSGAFVAGGADISRQSNHRTRWILKNVLDTKLAKRYWTFGTTISRTSDSQLLVANPMGSIHFEDLEDYVLSASTGAHIGTEQITRGDGTARFSSYAAAPFVESDVLRRSSLLLRWGLRADCQTAGGAIFSPRISAITEVHGYVLKAGTGVFVRGWSNGTFLKVKEGDGHHLQYFLIRNVSLADAEAGTATLENAIVSRISPNLTPARDWVAKFSIEHPMGRVAPGVEYTWTEGTHLLGSQRLSSPMGWTDLLESNRGLHQQQLHFRVQYGIRGHSFTAHYEWLHARDDTDGPFSFPARQSDVNGEWARSAVPAHNVSFVGNLQLGRAGNLVLIEKWHGLTPVNITSGTDAEHNGLYLDRAGLPRNRGHLPPCSSLDLIAQRRIPVPRLSEGTHRLYAVVGVQASNLLGNKDYIGIGTVIGSTLFGRALAGLPGRTVRFSLGFSR